MDHLLQVLSLPTPVQRSKFLSRSGYEVYVKRDDLIHPHISGNKYRKLKYNLIEAVDRGALVLITYGGAFSNHLVAVAAAGYHLGLRTVGIVRGYKLDDANPTLEILRSYNMEIHLVEPKEYVDKEKSAKVAAIVSGYEASYIIPEGGTNELALRGVAEGLLEIDDLTSYDTIIVALGTGGTVAGVCQAIEKMKTKVIGVSPFRGDRGVYKGLDYMTSSQRAKLEIVQSALDVKFGGYHPDIVRTINHMQSIDAIEIDPVYMSKTVYTLDKIIDGQNFERQSRILLLHSGGLQGAKGYENQYAHLIERDRDILSCT